jgi:hypothetical protein
MAQTHGSLQKISELFMMTESPGMVISVLITGRLSRLAAVLRDILCPIIFLIVSGILRYGFRNRYDSVFRLVLSLFSTVVISLANVQIFKYLSNIIRLPLKITLLIIAFYGLFVTNILLSFTPETYTYTLLFLSIFNYYSAKKINEEKPMSFGATIFGSVFIGGLTITNIVKVYIPFLFEKKIFWNWKKSE